MSTGSSSQSLEPQSPVPRSRLFYNPLAVIGLTLGIFTFSQILAWIILDAGSVAVGTSIGLNQSAASDFFYVLLVEALSVAAILAILKLAKLPLKKIGWGRVPKLSDLNYAVAGVILFYLSLAIIIFIISSLIPGYDNNQTQDVGFHKLFSSTDKILAFSSLVILAPIGEETLLRGYLYSALRSRWHYIPATALTSLLFGAAHLATGNSGVLWAAGVTTFIMSLFLVYVRQKTGALYSSVLIHMVNNFLAFFIYTHK